MLLSHVNKANLGHSFFLVYLSISTCFGRLFAHHQEKQLYLYDIWYLLFCVDDCQVCRSWFTDWLIDNSLIRNDNQTIVSRDQTLKTAIFPGSVTVGCYCHSQQLLLP